MKPDIQSAATSLTYDDYCLIPEDGKRYEVIEGVLYMSPAPFYRHQKALARLFAILNSYVTLADAGELLFAPFDVVFSEHDVVQPDILFISKERLSILTEKNAQGAPDLIIEILSERNRRHDEVMKKSLYERFGIKEYWIVDPARETVKVYKIQEDRYTLQAELDDLHAVLETTVLPGFRCTLEDVFS